MMPRGSKNGSSRFTRAARPARRPRPAVRRSTTSGLTSTETTPGSAAASARQRRAARRAPRRGRRRVRRAPAPSSAWLWSSSSMSSASAPESGTSRNATSPSASVSTPPIPTITHGPNCASVCTPAMSSRVPVIMGATRRSTAPSSGRGGREQRRRAAARTASASVRPSRTRPRSVLCAIASPCELHHDRVAERVGGRDRGVGVGHAARASTTGTPYRSTIRRESRSDEGLTHQTAVSRSLQNSSRSTRLSSLPDSVRGSSSRTS